MYPRMKSANPMISVSEINEFEESIGVQLPVSYKKFLLVSNGGRPDNSVFPIQDMLLNTEGNIQVFFGLRAKHRTSDLYLVYKDMGEAVPRSIVPIATTGFSDFICLDLRGGSERVVFWDRRPFWGSGIWREDDVYLIAANFDELLVALKPNAY